MRFLMFIPCIVAGAFAAGCEDSTRPRDVTPPSAPRGISSVTGDNEVYLSWFANPEGDVSGYRVYEGPCAEGPDCHYLRVGVTSGTEFVVRGLVNGRTRYFAVAAYDHSGNESPLSYQDVFDTPRPEGFDRLLLNAVDDPGASAYDFSADQVVHMNDDQADVLFGSRDGQPVMFTAFEDTDIQDAGYASSLDAVDYAPETGWSPTGSVELIAGHCYVVWTHDDHYAKFRVTSVSRQRVVFDWAYQVDVGNRELTSRSALGAPRVRRTLVWGR